MRNSRLLDYALDHQARQWVVRRQLWHARHKEGDKSSDQAGARRGTRVSPAGTPVSLSALVIQSTIALSLTATTVGSVTCRLAEPLAGTGD